MYFVETMPTLLVANRGEIAIRICKTAKKKGWKTVAIYSDADRHALHISYADEAYRVGGSPSKDSYLNINQIIKIAKDRQVDYIHPGYGFLSENAEFAQAVWDNGITFVGPTAEAMQSLGNKVEAKITAGNLGIPLVPGMKEPVDEKIALSIADRIGYPIILKAAAGGGGKGMRVVQNPSLLLESLSLAQSEALSSFGDPTIFIEKFIQSPKHIEVQVLADQLGHVIALPERECSLQRRHQKIMEESPSALLDDSIRKKMQADALKLIQSTGYFGTATVEFILDSDGNYFFLEVNTRLQVEHTVTEMITGLDLVDLQLDIAQKKSISIKPSDIQVHGHAIQWRVYAEDADNHFAPSVGTIDYYEEPVGKDIRIDAGYKQGSEIPIYYDPMISKMIAWGRDRGQCILTLHQALKNYSIEGVITSIPFGIKLLTQTDILEGHYTVDYLDKNLDRILKDGKDESVYKAAAALSLFLHRNKTLNL